jgi:integrase
MSTASSFALTSLGEPRQWRMPIEPSDYSGRDPSLSTEERQGIEHLLALSSRQSQEYESQAAQIARITQPLFDIIALFQRCRPNSRVAQRHFINHLLSYVLQTNTVYWGWTSDVWECVIDALPTRSNAAKRRKEPGYATISSPIFLLTYLTAYLLAGVLHARGKRPFPSQALGEIIFGSMLMQTAIDKANEPLLTAGYTTRRRGQEGFIRITILALLMNRSPFLEAISPATLKTLYKMYPKAKTRVHIDLLQRVLLALDMLPCEGWEETETKRLPKAQVFRAESLVGLHPQWVTWLQAFWQQTPITQCSRDSITSQMLIACRWLAQYYPQVTEPSQWTRELAAQYVAYVCNQATVYDYASQETRQYLANHLKHRQGEKLAAATMNGRLGGVRRFFRCLQKYSYEVDGTMTPRLGIDWNPDDVLATPKQVVAQIQPNPRNVEEEAWLKLVWTACTLNAEMVKEAIPGAKMYPLLLWRAVALVWVTGCRRRDEIRRLPLECVRSEWAPEMVDENGVQLEPAENLWYLLVPTSKYRGTFWTPIPEYTAEAILAWKAIRPKNQSAVEDRKTGKRTEYLFQYRGKIIGEEFINNHLIPLLCKASGLVDEEGKPYMDAVGPITSHRARSSTAFYLKAMGMAPYDIGKLLGHTDPNRTLPWYLKENLHQLGRTYRKANPLDRTVQALLDTTAAAKGEPCVFYYLSDGPDGRPRLCGNPNFRTCYHQLQCAECEAYIDTEMAEVIERRPGCLQVSVSIPLPEQLVEDLNNREEGIPVREPPPPPPIPSAAFHFNTKVTARIEEPSNQSTSESDQLHMRLVGLEAQLAAKGKQDARNVSTRLLKQEISQLKKQILELGEAPSGK